MDKKGKIESYIVLNDDHTDEKLSEFHLANQKEQIEASLKNKLILMANNMRVVEEVITIVKEEKKIPSPVKRKVIKMLNNNSNKRMIEDIDFEFIKSEEGFYQKLISQYPNLTKGNLKLCSYLKMNLSTKEIAIIHFVSPESVKVSRSRLRKKLGIDTSVTLSVFLNNI